MSKGAIAALVVGGLVVVGGGLYFAHNHAARAAGIPDIPKAAPEVKRTTPTSSAKAKAGRFFSKFGARAVSKLGTAALNQASTSVPGAQAVRTILA